MEWFYSDDDTQRGPVSDEELQAAYDSGMVTPSTLVWSEGMTDWLPFGEVVDLTGGGAPQAAPPAPPAAPVPVAADTAPEPGDAAPAPAAASTEAKKTGSGRKKMMKKKSARGGKPSATSTRTKAAGKGTRKAAKTGTTRSPYAAPGANLDTDSDGPVVLAGRMDRLIAIIIDCLIGLIVVVPLFGIFTGPSKTVILVIAGLSFCLFIGLMIAQIRCVIKNSASLGKNFMKIYITDLQGRPASAGKIIGMRGIVGGLLFGIIPLGAFINIGLIFRADRRCGHDLVAGTQVLKRT